MRDARIQAVKDTWSALPEVDALLAQLRQDHIGVRDAVRGMSIEELAGFRIQLAELSNALYDVAVGIARAGEPAPWLPHRKPDDA